MVSLLNSLPDISCKMPGGAFYAFPSFEKYLGKKIKNKTINNSFDLSDLFLSEVILLLCQEMVSELLALLVLSQHLRKILLKVCPESKIY